MMKIRNLFLLVMISGIALSCDNAEELNRSYTLEWEDDFEGPAGELPNPNDWNYDLGGGGFGNNELQVYTNNPENVSKDGNGNLVITAIRNGNNFTSARIKTQDKFERTYGRFEARLKTPYGPGVWPAFWLLGDGVDDPAIGWPQTGEIDIMELRGQEPSKIAGSVHGPGYSAGNAVTSDFELENARFDTEYHVFAVDWGPDFIDFFVDDNLYQRITPGDVPGEWVFDHNFFIIFNIAVGGNYVGFPSPDTPFPQKMTIDYIRFYTF
ncbi:MAG: glycoside hydrolase family 16 protein [Cyclobacteriaceae bacterium]